MAMKRVFKTIHMVMVRSTNGSITTRLTICFTFNQYGEQSQIKNMLANLYQQGGHFCLDSSSSRLEKNKNHHQKIYFIIHTFISDPLDYFFSTRFPLLQSQPLLYLQQNKNLKYLFFRLLKIFLDTHIEQK